jgi:hypothetical protein
MKRLSFQGFDVALAVQARRVIMMETHSVDECVRLVYKPTQDLLKKIAGKHPDFLVFMHRSPYRYKGTPGFSVDVDVVMPNKKVAYLATVITRAQAQSEFEFHRQAFQKLLKALDEACSGRRFEPIEDYKAAVRYKLELLEQRGPMAIRREHVGCKVPVDSNRLCLASIANGVERYLQTFAPQIVGVQINWMPSMEQRKLYEFIIQKAKETAIPQTDNDRKKVIAEDDR